MTSNRRSRAAAVAEPDLGLLDEAGWMAVPGVFEPDDARRLAAACTATLAGIGDDVRVGDKQVGGTLHLGDVVERVPGSGTVLDHPMLMAAVEWFLGAPAPPAGVSFRCPQPGFGEQRFHADDAPLLTPGAWRAVTAIVALCDFTADNGATAVVPGSHRRPDLQRRSGNLERHRDELVLTGEAGTAFVFSGHLLHRGTRNRSTETRPALQMAWRQGH